MRASGKVIKKWLSNVAELETHPGTLINPHCPPTQGIKGDFIQSLLVNYAVSTKAAHTWT